MLWQTTASSIYRLAFGAASRDLWDIANVALQFLYYYLEVQGTWS